MELFNSWKSGDKMLIIYKLQKLEKSLNRKINKFLKSIKSQALYKKSYNLPNQ